MSRTITRGAAAGAGLIFHVFAQDSTSTSGAGKASVAFGDWSCRYIRNGEAISGAITPQDITTIGTYAAPTANTNIRIKAVDNTNMIGVYEIQIHADWVNTTNTCQSLTIYLTAAGVAVLPLQIPLTGLDMQVLQASAATAADILTDTAEIGVAGAGLTNINLPNQTMDITGNLSGSVGSVTAGVTVTTNNDKSGYALTQSFPANFASLTISVGGVVAVDIETVNGQTIIGAGIPGDLFRVV